MSGINKKPASGEDASNFEPTVSSSSFVYNPYMSLDLESQRNKLPITKHRNDVLYLCEKFQTLILVGSTGSGKSTQVPQVCFIPIFILLHHLCYKPNIHFYSNKLQTIIFRCFLKVAYVKMENQL